MSYDLIELTLLRLGEQLPERLSPCLEFSSNRPSLRQDPKQTFVSAGGMPEKCQKQT